MQLRLYLKKDDTNRDLFKKAAYFFVDELISKKLKNNLSISINIRNDIGELWGYCEWMDRPYRPRKFNICISTSISTQNKLITLAHEFVHVKQFALAELYQSSKKSNHYNHKGLFYPFSTPISESPWELEANKYEMTLYKKFILINKNKT